jgi:putative transposase
MVITAKIKLQTTPAQFAALRATQLAFRDALNYVSQYAFTHGKMSNKEKLQKGTYQDLRTRFHLPSQTACSVSRHVELPIKGWGRRRNTTLHIADKDTPRNATKDWIRLLRMLFLR